MQDLYYSHSMKKSLEDAQKVFDGAGLEKLTDTLFLGSYFCRECLL